jgi:hypothetical protein
MAQNLKTGVPTIDLDGVAPSLGIGAEKAGSARRQNIRNDSDPRGHNTPSNSPELETGPGRERTPASGGDRNKSAIATDQRTA